MTDPWTWLRWKVCPKKGEERKGWLKKDGLVRYGCVPASTDYTGHARVWFPPYSGGIYRVTVTLDMDDQSILSVSEVAVGFFDFLLVDYDNESRRFTTLWLAFIVEGFDAEEAA